MTTPIEKVRAALKRVIGSEAVDEALAELEGKAIVPIEPTHSMIEDGIDSIQTVGCSYKNAYKAMIAPYVPEEKK